MKRAKQLFERFFLACLLGLLAGGFGFGNEASFAAAPESEAADKTLSPYFFVQSENPELDQLPLKSTAAVANVAGVIADVKVTQVYKNEGKRPLEAVYVFPASTRAAVYGMKMTIGERVIVAKIQKREEARAAYEQAKKEGKSASLLEQQRPNVFQMNVANILPGDEIKTELSYTELLTPADGVYEFVYPTVVGPRYSNQKAAETPPSEQWVANPYLQEKQPPTYSFDITVGLAAGIPIQEAACTSHKVDIRYEDPSRAVVSLAPTEKSGGNKDFILKYRLAGDRIESGLLLYQGEEENLFLLMAQPPKRVVQAEIPPREYIFIVDVSGSMFGFPLEISKKLIKDLIGGLRPTDSFNVLLFAGGSHLMAERSLPATPENVQKAVQLIESQRGGGGTELLPALQRALALPRAEGTARTVIIATDGYVAVETRAFDLIRTHLGDASFFPFGIGTSVNRFLMEGMARAGSGEPFIVANVGEAPARAEKFRHYVQSPLLTRVKLDFGGFQTYDVEPQSVPDVFAERPVIVFGKWRGQPKGKISLRGFSGNQSYESTVEVASVKPLESNSALRSLWARSAITRLSDYNVLQPSDERIAQVTDLGLKYSLLTAYTSFVAVDSQVRRKEGEPVTVQQPLPLPEGVSNYAVGGIAPGAAVHYKRMAPAPSGRPAGTRMTQPLPAESMAETKAAKSDEARGQEKPCWTVALDKLSVRGGLSEAPVKRIIRENLKTILDCLPEGAKTGATRQVTVRWTVTAEGKVMDVKIVSSKPGSKDVVDCVKDGIAPWQFDARVGAKTTVTATFTLTFGGR